VIHVGFFRALHHVCAKARATLGVDAIVVIADACRTECAPRERRGARTAWTSDLISRRKLPFPPPRPGLVSTWPARAPGAMLVAVTARPQPPFESWPRQAFDPVFGYLWYAQPAIVVTQSIIEHASVAMATFVHDLIDQVIEYAAQDIAQHHGLLFIHDFRSLSGYETEARLEFLARIRRRTPGYTRGTVVAIRMDQPLLRMGVQGANLLLSVAMKAPVSMVSDPAEAVALEVRRAPCAADRFPGR
jgi:hypothetical protein